MSFFVNAGKSLAGGAFSMMKGAVSAGVDYLPPSVKSYLGYEDLEVENPDDSNEETANALLHAAGEANVREQWKKWSSFVGTDVLAISFSLPIWAFEPTTALQRQCEMLEYSELLDKAAACDKPIDRLAYVAAFAVSVFHHTERFGKPFNPILGETFEFIRKDKKVRYIAEQVSHHPPVGAAHCTGEGWVLKETSNPKTKFFGNSIEIYTSQSGSRSITFTKEAETFTWTTPTTCVHNLLLGSTWIDHYGTVTVTCDKHAAKAVLHFKKCGWGSAQWHAIEGGVYDENGAPRIALEGRWNEVLTAQRVADDGRNPDGEPFTLWQGKPKTQNKWRFTDFTEELNSLDPECEKELPPTDSRIRPDRRALQKGESSLAGSEKHRLEEKQRAERRAREAAAEQWVPRWFKKEGEDGWAFTGDYWSRPWVSSSELHSKLVLFEGGPASSPEGTADAGPASNAD